MIKEILGIIFIGILTFFGVKFSMKKLKKDQDKKQEEYEKEFSEGNILIPVDKRDFENLEEFKEKISHLPSVKKTLKNLDKDFEGFESILKENENTKEETN